MMRPKKLSAEEMDAEAKRTPGWSVAGDQIVHDFSFADFVQAMAFVNRMADAAEQMNHHPDIDIRYNRVKLSLSTHDAGGLTASDFELARRINGLNTEA